jgi:hypothetical protein
MFGRFKGKQAQPPKGDESQDNPAEAEAVVAIKARSELGRIVAGRLSDPNEDQVEQRSRYERILDDCIARADCISDDFYKGAAVHQIIELCVAGGDLLIARALLLAVRDNFIRQMIFESAPELNPTSKA